MIGAILGDIVGSPYEFDRGKKVKDFGPWWRLRYAHLYYCRDRGGFLWCPGRVSGRSFSPDRNRYER